MSRVFISYRREDSQDASGRIFDRLAHELGRDQVFMDVDNIPPGVDFRDHLKQSVQQCDVLLAVIGKRWIDLTDEHGKRRIDHKDDFVRIEIELALKQTQTLVVPVLLHEVKMPPADQLPEPLQKLAYRNAMQVRHNNFQRDLDLLVNALKTTRKSSPPSTSPSEQAAPKTPPATNAASASPPPMTVRKSKRNRRPPKLPAAPPTPPSQPPSQPAPPSPSRKSSLWELYAGMAIAIVVTAIVLGLAAYSVVASPGRGADRRVEIPE